MAERRRVGLRRWFALALLGFVLLVVAASFIWQDDILQAALDPKEPFQTYQPPPAPDYANPAAWALTPDASQAGLPADIFFVSPTLYDGGRHWNAPLTDVEADRFFRRAIAPNYVGPFVRVGRIYAPRYRQASLYTLLTLREDAREARRFAYEDVAAAFRWYRDHDNRGRPFVLVGVEQGGTLADRLLAEEIAPDPALRARLVAAYLIGTIVPAAPTPVPPCISRPQAGCLAAWSSATLGDLERVRDLKDRSLVWGEGGQLTNLQGRTPLCFNPVLGAVTDQPAPARLHLGAANATGLEWGARPAFLSRQLSARCEAGILRITRPKSSSLRPTGTWADRKKVPGYNLFYADLEADAEARLAAWQAANAAKAP